MNESQLETMVFFDGYCGLCNSVVDFLIERDVNSKLRYSPLQGETARLLLSETRRNDLDTVVVIVRDASGAVKEELTKSDAVFRALEQLSPDWSGFTKALRIFPKFFRDMVYDLIAQNRFKLFGKRDSCRAPSQEERKLFLP